MPTSRPLAGFFFQVTLAGTASQPVDSGFAEVTGLDVNRELVELVEGGENEMVHQLPGRMKHGNLVLKRGLVGATDPLFLWCKASLESDLGVPFATQDLEVALLDHSARKLITWTCFKAWPVKWGITGLQAKEGQVAMESVEFAYQRVARAYQPGGGDGSGNS
jgi:phage tail-like protein